MTVDDSPDNLFGGATNVFTRSDQASCAALFVCRRRMLVSPSARSSVRSRLALTLEMLAAEGWALSVGGMFGRAEEATAFDTGPIGHADFVGAFEAPSVPAAFDGVNRLTAAGWDALWRTEWILGPREFAPVQSDKLSQGEERKWGFFALWAWNAAWQAATPEQRREYDAHCDIAFASDVAAGVNIAGRHRIDASSRWGHLAIWEAPTVETVVKAMQEHERVADFKFTASRHYLGRKTSLSALMGASGDFS